MCKCVGFFLVDELLCMILLSSLFSLDVDYLSLLFFFDMPCGHVAYLLWVCIFIIFFSFFWHAFWACGIPFLGMHLLFLLLLFFFIAHILDSHFREKESWYVMEFYFVGGWQCLLCEWACTWSWSLEYERFLTWVIEFNKAKRNRSCIGIRFSKKLKFWL